MVYTFAKVLMLVSLAAALGTIPAAAAPVDSDLAAAPNGGGCYPTGINPAVLDMLTLINPEWAPIVNGQTVDSAPVLVHGTVQGMHGDTSGDFPATHVRADVNHFVALDPVDAVALRPATTTCCSISNGRPARIPHGLGPVRETAWSGSAAGSSTAATPARRPAPAPARARPAASSMATAPAVRPAPPSTSSTAPSCILPTRRPPSEADAARSSPRARTRRQSPR